MATETALISNWIELKELSWNAAMAFHVATIKHWNSGELFYIWAAVAAAGCLAVVHFYFELEIGYVGVEGIDIAYYDWGD